MTKSDASHWNIKPEEHLKISRIQSNNIQTETL